jgi:hydroxymethylbilane synthase
LQLAMVQTELVVGLLQELYPSVEFEIVAMTTTGDQVFNYIFFQSGDF